MTLGRGRRVGLALALAMAGLAPAPAQPGAAPAVDVGGIWDLTWMTRRGPQQRGYLRLEQQGQALRAEIHGQGSVKARGTLNGRAFQLRGSRMMVPYRIEGRIDGNRMEGALKVVSVERRFTGVRRGG